MVRLVQLSDIHFGGEDVAAAQAAADFVMAERPDLVIFTGDFTLNGLPREFRAARRWFDALPQPKLATPGNHDTPYWNIPLRALTPFNRYRRNIGPPGSGSFDSDEVSVRMLNTARGAQPRPDWSKGAINLKTAHADVTALANAAPGALRVIGCHHPLIEVADTPVTGGVHRGALAAEIFALGQIDLILTGHVHVPFAVALPYGDAMTYAVGASTLSVRTRGAAPGFNVIEADAAMIDVTAMDWTGAAFVAGQTWSLKRRRT
ncbi:MAG: metallophosphoesterase family protein [Caulobacteraceae bacterium]